MIDTLSSLRNFIVLNANRSHDHLSAPDDTARISEEASAALFTRQIHRIRILKLAYANLHDLFYEQPSATNDSHDDKEVMGDGHALSAGLPDLCLEELCIDFADDPRRFSSFSNVPTSRSTRPLLQVLDRSKNLRKLTINLWMLGNQSEDLSRLFAALPLNLERLDLEFWPKDTTDGQQDVFPTLRTFGALKALRIRYLSRGLHFNLVMSLLERCSVLEEFDAVVDVTTESNFLDDARLAKILSIGSKGWKTLAVRPGPLSVAVILKHCPTLQNLQIPMCQHQHLTSAFI